MQMSGPDKCHRLTKRSDGGSDVIVTTWDKNKPFAPSPRKCTIMVSTEAMDIMLEAM
jgi:hypothetical protein